MSGFYISTLFTTLEEFQVAGKNWDLDFIQLDNGSFQASLTQLGDRELTISTCKWNRHLHQRGSSPPDCFTFAIYAPNSINHRWRLIDCPVNSMRIFPGDNELDSVTPPGCQNLVISVSRSYLKQVSIELGYPEMGRLIQEGTVVCCDPLCIRHLQFYLIELFRVKESVSNHSCPEQILNRSTKWKIIRFLFQALSSAQSIQYKKPVLKKHRVISRVVEYIQANLSEEISIPELCSIAEVSERSLRYIFDDYFSTNPQRYLRNYRLNKIKMELASLDNSEIKISDIANTNGLWHMGKFAKDYRQLFSELPSETLRRQ